METVLIAGGTGLVGTHLQKVLAAMPYRVLVLSRSKKGPGRNAQFIQWNPARGTIDDLALEADHVVNLAGAGIADKRWTKSRKQKILDSRIQTTKLLIDFFRLRDKKLNSFINASAMGFYGDAGDKILTEETPTAKEDFLSHVCQLWEAEAALAREVARSVSILRISTVLSVRGGALPKMMGSAPFGLGVYFGTGKQFMSWIHIEDLCRMIAFCLKQSYAFEIFNASTDPATRNREFARIIIDVVKPVGVLLPAPAIALKLAMGEMSSIVLNSHRLTAKKINASGFVPLHNDPASAIRDLLGRNL